MYFIFTIEEVSLNNVDCSIDSEYNEVIFVDDIVFNVKLIFNFVCGSKSFK